MLKEHVQTSRKVLPKVLIYEHTPPLRPGLYQNKSQSWNKCLGECNTMGNFDFWLCRTWHFFGLKFTGSYEDISILFRENKGIFLYFSRGGEGHKKSSPFWKLRNGASSQTLLRVLSSPHSQHVLSQDLNNLGTWMPTDKKRSPNFLQKCLRSKDDAKEQGKGTTFCKAKYGWGARVKPCFTLQHSQWRGSLTSETQEVLECGFDGTDSLSHINS